MSPARRAAQALIAVSLLGLLGVTAWYWRLAWEDSGRFAFVLFGVPLLCAVLALVAERSSRSASAPVVTGVSGAVSLGWSLVTGLGIGLAFALPSLLLLAAAAVSWGQLSVNGSRRP